MAVLGTYEGECADANITNKNGLDITREVWENVFNSDEYKEAIERGWYIGFLGHPEDPACQDFEHACIIMTDGYIDDNGKIYGSFNLVDTPVGRIVKAFQDAGVTFGISVRGAGDIISNSVDPETFVFRGFDLVAFPAYPDAIPTFTEIAASSDPAKQKMYKILCSTVKDNAEKITDKRTLDIIKQSFAPQSDEYHILEERESVIESEQLEETDEDVDVLKEKVNAMTALYLEAINANKALSKELSDIKHDLKHTESRNNRKIASMHRLTKSQLSIMANKNKEDLDKQSKINLIYKQRVNSSKSIIDSKDAEISALRSKLRETVTASKATESRVSDLDAKNRKLKEKIEACEELIAEYQDAYTYAYCSAIGTRPSSVKVTASTSVSELQDLISTQAATNMANMLVQPEIIEIDDETVEDEADSSIVML